jgi:hypothetical protein
VALTIGCWKCGAVNCKSNLFELKRRGWYEWNVKERDRARFEDEHLVLRSQLSMAINHYFGNGAFMLLKKKGCMMSQTLCGRAD